MDKLSNNINAYYREHFSELTFDKQLHFASRLFLWCGDNFGLATLKTLRPTVTCNEDPAVALKTVYQQAITTIHHGSKNAALIRAPYFEKYPLLRPVAMVLFRLTFLKTIYGLDARKTLFELFDKKELEELMTSLLADHEALSILSTHAINVLYLYHRVVLEDDAALDPGVFLQVGATQYDLDDPIQLQLYIYLYTHCVIGESKFYARALPVRYLPAYRAMMDELEDVMEQRFTQINLDNKFEFLVCCKLAGKTSGLADRIEAEAQKSISTDGTYLVDRHNTNPQIVNNTLDLSEHRNVLYLLAQTDPLFRSAA